MIWRAESVRSVERNAWGSQRRLGSRTSTRAEGHRGFARVVPHGGAGGQLEPTPLAAVPAEPTFLPAGVSLPQPLGQLGQLFAFQPRAAPLAGPTPGRRRIEGRIQS